ncbi:MAG: ATP-binding cassette domain-containing protein [Clostridiales bacterium]|jgi:ABC-2 type transport system ATP-binding protein|nr:ATP-binding cassette domain-containing protein [Clostridiales bacterium]
MVENIIIVESATKIFKKSTVLNNVTVSFEKGKIHGIIGRNGSGKTVLFKCICGFMPLTSGSISVSGKVIGKQIDIPKDIGIIIEAPGFISTYSGYKNLKLLASIQKKIRSEEIKQSIRRVGLEPESKKWVGKYSLGMKQRLGIAQAIMEKPEILILDEPMNGLDNKGVEEMRQLLLELKQEGKTILLASHNSEDICHLCDTVHEMDTGIIKTIRLTK